MRMYNCVSDTCKCKGSWSTLTSDTRMYLTNPCENHEIKEGNYIYYELKYLLEYIHKNKQIFKDKYLIKILNVVKIDNNKLIKVELNHDGELDTNNFNYIRQMYFLK
jgi:hypothetical protein